MSGSTVVLVRLNLACHSEMEHARSSPCEQVRIGCLCRFVSLFYIVPLSGKKQNIIRSFMSHMCTSLHIAEAVMYRSFFSRLKPLHTFKQSIECHYPVLTSYFLAAPRIMIMAMIKPLP